MSETVTPLQYQSTKIHPIFKKYLNSEVARKKIQSLNHGINAALYERYKGKMSAKELSEVKRISFGANKPGRILKRAPIQLS